MLFGRLWQVEGELSRWSASCNRARIGYNGEKREGAHSKTAILRKRSDIMPILDISIDTLLTTTRSVRKRLDLARPVEPEVIRECLDLAVQAPTASNSQNWHFVVVTDPEPRQARAAIYRKGAERYKKLMVPILQKQAATSEQAAGTLTRMLDSGQYLIDHLHDVPGHVIPCIEGRTEQQPIIGQAA